MKPIPKPILITEQRSRHVYFMAAPGVDVTPLADYGELQAIGKDGNVTRWYLRISDIYRVKDVVAYVRQFGTAQREKDMA